MMGDVAMRFYTIEHLPVREYHGAVSFWARDPDLTTAEEKAVAGLAERAIAMGGDTIVGLRIETEQELAIGSEPSALGSVMFVSSAATYRVYVSGTAANA